MTDLAVVAQELQAHLVKEIGFIVTDKESSDQMKAVALGMDMARVFSSGLPSGKDFMERYATTIMKEVFIPKIIRDNPLSLMVVGTHEAEHVLQFKDTGVEFVGFYGFSTNARGQFEADGYAAGLSVQKWLTGRSPKESLTGILDGLVASYNLKPENRVYCETALKSHMASIESGIYMTRTARISIAWLEAHHPELKGAVAA